MMYTPTPPLLYQSNGRKILPGRSHFGAYMCVKVANPHEFEEPRKSEPEEEGPVPDMATMMLSPYSQEKEMSLMVAALTQVVAGDRAAVVGSPSYNSSYSPSQPLLGAHGGGVAGGVKRGREEMIPESVLRYYRGSAPEFGSSPASGESSTIMAGDY